MPPITTSNDTLFPLDNLTCALGPRPERLKAGDRPTLFMFDAAMVDGSESLFPEQATTAQYARLMALSAVSETPLIFATTPLEHQVLDSLKEKIKKARLPDTVPIFPNMRCWYRATEGRGIVKRFPNMRCIGFVHQEFVLSQVCTPRKNDSHS